MKKLTHVRIIKEYFKSKGQKEKHFTYGEYDCVNFTLLLTIFKH